MLPITLMAFNFTLFLEGWFDLFVQNFFGVGCRGHDDGYLARLVAHLAMLASWPLILRQGSRVRSFVFMTNLPAMEETESGVKFEFSSSTSRRAQLFT